MLWVDARPDDEGAAFRAVLLGVPVGGGWRPVTSAAVDPTLGLGVLDVPQLTSAVISDDDIPGGLANDLLEASERAVHHADPV